VLRRCDLEGMKQHDYAAAAGLTLAAVKSRLLRARKRIREQLLQHCEVEFDTSGNVCCHARNKRDGARPRHPTPD
jgi:RNA polymerase sigma-70 factor (ECF subfamily)